MMHEHKCSCGDSGKGNCGRPSCSLSHVPYVLEAQVSGKSSFLTRHGLTCFCLSWQVHFEGLRLPEEHSQRHNETQNILEYSTDKCAAIHALGLELGGDPALCG